MFQLRRSCLPALVVLLPWLCLTAGCGKDGLTGPLGGEILWRPVDLGAYPLGGAMVAIDFAGDHGAALGYGLSGKATNAPVIYRYDAGAWTEDTPTDLPPGELYLDLALDDAGSLVLAGYVTSGDNRSRLYDARGEIHQTLERMGLGLKTVAGDGSFFVAGGYTPGGQLWTSLTPSHWTVDALPLTGTNDSGFEDIYVRGDIAVACGFDDGADTLQVILERTTTTGWQKVPLGGNPFGVSYKSIALNDMGAIFVGGMIGAGGPSPRAYMALRGSGVNWTELVLPDPGLIGQVNDILISAAGDIYIACSGEVPSGLATILRAGPDGVTREIIPFPGDLFQMAQAADGTIYAVGVTRTANGFEKPLMLKRVR